MFTPGSLTGKQIDQFRLEEFIGQGAMGMVYKATDTILNRAVALKLISKKSDVTTPAMAEARKRLIQEAQAAGRLAHPNIVTIHSYGETEDFQYICMEYITGRTLAEILNEQKVLSVEEAGAYFEQILLAIEAANREQIVHRDIKPTNIMIMADKRLKVMDFGIAKIPSLSITTTGTVLGTPYYMSPEQISGQKVDIRSDIFSVGAVFYQVLTGERPFEGESTVTLAYKIVQVEPIPPKVLNVHIPPAIENIVKKALAKDPFQRYQTPGEMLADLRAALRPSAPPKPAVSDTTIKSKMAAFDQTVQISPKESRPAAEEPPLPPKEPPPAKKKPEAAEAVPEPAGKPAPKPAPAPPAAAAPKAGGSAVKTLAISGGLLLVMVVIIVLVVRLVKKPSAVTPPPPADLSQKSPAAESGVTAQVKTQAEQLVAQAKNDLSANPTNAQKLLEQAVSLDPKNFEAQFQLARLLTMRKNYPAAIRHYQEALALNNQVPEIPFNLGFIYLNQGDYDLAIRYYESCRALSPPYQDEVLTNLGIAYLKKNNPAQAQLFFKQAIGLNPNNTLARNYLQAQPASGTPAPVPSSPPAVDNPAQAAALIAQAKGQFQTNPARAQSLLEQAAKLDPGNYESPYQLGRLLTFQKNYPQAVQHYQAALKLNPRVPEIHFNLGYILMTQGQFDQAIKYFESCRALSPPFQDEVLTNLGISYLKKNNPAQAQFFFREALKINPKNSLARSYLQSLGG